MNDNFCHDANNLQECQWDGGDCCGNENENWDMFCEACECLDPLTCVWPEWAGDQKCDDVTNTRAHVTGMGETVATTTDVPCVDMGLQKL